MATTPFKKVISREMYGADISGLQDAINKIETVLDMHTAGAANHALHAVSDQPEPAQHRRLYEGTIRNWLETPTPIVRRSGVVVPSVEYTLYAAQGLVVFHQQQEISATVTADFTYIRSESPFSNHVGSGDEAHAAASSGVAGFMSATDKARFDALDVLSYRRAGTYHAGLNSAAFSPQDTLANNLDIMPFYVPAAQTFDRIAINVTTPATGNARLGIYFDSGAVYPGALLLDAGTVTTETLGIRALTITLNLPPGLYWLARLQDAAPSIQGLSTTGAISLGSEDLATSITGYRLGRAYGEGLPAPFSAGAALLTEARPAVFLRRA